MKLYDIYQYIEENRKMEYVFRLNIWQDFARWAKNAESIRTIYKENTNENRLGVPAQRLKIMHQSTGCV